MSEVDNEAAENGGEIVITKNGRPTTQLVAYRQNPRTLFGIDQGKLEILGDITAPVGDRGTKPSSSMISRPGRDRFRCRLSSLL